MSEHTTEQAAFGPPRPDPALVEIAEAVANALADRPQRCGHSSDPTCCPYENFPTLAAIFDPEPDPADTCGLDDGYGRCGLHPGHDEGLHAVPIGGGSDPIDDPEVWFVFGPAVEKPEYRSLKLEADRG